MGTFHEDICKFMIIPLGSLLRMRNVFNKICKENQNTCYAPQIYFSKNCAVYEIMWRKHNIHFCASTATMVM
jgi:hypothetical protein